MSGKFLCAITVVCLAGSVASARPFPYSTLTLDAGGGLPGTLGAAFTTSDGSAFFNHPSGSDIRPTAGAIAGDPSLAFDSYFGMDGVGPSTAGYTSAAVVTTPGSFILGSSASAGYFRLGPAVPFGTSPGGLPGLFVGRFVTAPGVGVVNPDFQVEFLVGGVQSYALNGPAGFDGIELNEYLTINPAGGLVAHDIWLEVIPTPGAAALAGIAGLAGLRRRRA